MIEIGKILQQIKEEKKEKEEKDKIEKEKLLKEKLKEYDERELGCFMNCCNSFQCSINYKEKYKSKPDFSYQQINSKKTTSDGATIEKNEKIVEGSFCSFCRRTCCLIF